MTMLSFHDGNNGGKQYMNNAILKRFCSAVSEYLSDLRYENLSNTTINNYQCRLRYFYDFWKETNPSSWPCSNDIRAWRDSLCDAGVSTKTIKQYLIELKAFFSYCIDEGICKNNPVTKRVIPRTNNDREKPYDKLLSAEDIEKLWENRNKGKNWERNYAITMLLLDGKIRNAELLDMKLSDINFEYNEIRIVRGKGRKFRYVTMNDISSTAIQLYLASGRRPKRLSDDDYLFGTMGENVFGGRTKGCAWHRGSSSWLSSLVERHVKNVTGKEGIRTHALRHNGAMLDLNNGVPIERLQSELGHASVQTTEIYSGKLGSRRHQDSFIKAIASRDYWAEFNKDLLMNKYNIAYSAA